MLFLGAGASAAFGVPTLQQLTSEAEALLNDKGFEPTLIDEIKQALGEYRLTLDFESLLTILQAFARPDEAIHASGPLAAYLAHKMQGSIPAVDRTDDYIQLLKNLLVKKCAAANIDDATAAYRRLFETFAVCNRICTGGGSYVNFKGGYMDAPRHMRTQDIFTLNYDVVIENVLQNLGLDETLFTGFQSFGTHWLWRPNSYHFEENVRPPCTNLVKMHGSIDQFVLTNGEIEKRQADPQVGYYKSEALGEMMIFPVHEKYVTMSPYVDLYNLFRWSLQTDPLCVVIGYSFRDEAVNNAFIDAVKTNRNLKFLYVGGQRAEDNIKRIPVIQSRTKCLNWRFDYAAPSFGLIGELRNYIEVWYPK